MKTISRITLVLGLFVTSLSTNSLAQSPLVELQSMETTLNADIASIQASITSQQNLLSAVAADLQTAMDEGDVDSELAWTSRQNDLNASIALQQVTLAQLQADLAAVQGKIVSTQNEMNLMDRGWVLANASSTPAPPDSRILNVPDPYNPSTLNIIFGSTGNAEQDNQILRAWLLQYGLIDAE